jgi:hypothetical protein
LATLSVCFCRPESHTFGQKASTPTIILQGLFVGIIVNTIYFAIVLFLGVALWKRLRKPVVAAEQIVELERR